MPRGRTKEGRESAAPELALPAVLPNAVAMTWKPQEFQEKVLACLNGVTFAVGGVGSGKSEAGAFLLLKWALRHPRRKDGTPTEWFIVGPEFNLVRAQQFQKVLNQARRLRDLGYGSIIRRVVTGQNPRIELVDGQVLYGRSGDVYQRMEGIEVEGMWQDEAQRQPEEAFHTGLQRMRSSDSVRAVVTASPEDSPGWIWRAISGDPSYAGMRAALVKASSGFRVFRWSSDANAANEGAVLDVIGQVLKAKSQAKVDQKLRGRFPGTPESPSLSILNYTRAFTGRLDLRGEEARPYALGIDIGETTDFTWLTVMSSRGVVLWMERFNAGSPGVPRERFFPFLEERIDAIASVWRVKRLIIDTAKSGKPLAQSLSERMRGDGKPRVECVDTSTPNKKPEVIESLNLAMAAGRVRVPTSWCASPHPEQTVPEVAQLRKEFEELVIKEVGKRRTFDHPSGGHDDGIVSLALAWRGVDAPAANGAGLSSWKSPSVGDRWFSGAYDYRFGRQTALS